MSDLDHKDLFQAVQRALTGHSDLDVLQALVRSLVVAVGVSAPSIEQAEQWLDAMLPEIKTAVRQDWPKFRAHRGLMSG